jgi:hypothetical protein
MRCGLAENVTASLRKGGNERPILEGVTAAGELMQVWASPDRSKWTVTVSKGGKMCIREFGNSLELPNVITVEPPT